MIELQAKCTCKASPPSNSCTSGCTVHYRQHCKGNKAVGCEQNIKVHVTIHLQATCWAAGSEKETVMTCSLCSVCCSIDAWKPAAAAMTFLSADHLKSAPSAVCQPDLCRSCMQAQAVDNPFPVHMRPRGCTGGWSLVGGTGLLHGSLGINTHHQACSI